MGPVRASDPLGDQLELGPLRQIGAEDLDLDTLGPQLEGERVEQRLPTSDQYEVRSFAGQHASKLGADARGCTRHERSFPSWHRVSVRPGS
jgi:hypothetical protein